MNNLDTQTIELIEREYVHGETPWALGYSGGKDSTAMLKLVYNALLSVNKPTKHIKVVYCDTGVEIPVVSNYVKKVFKSFNEEINESGLPIITEIVEPVTEERFFAKVIGRGYPTPTNKFRWCTDRLRIRPIQYSMLNDKFIILVGVRKGESLERDKIITKNEQGNGHFLKQDKYSSIRIFAPIINYNVENVWETIRSNYSPTSLFTNELELIYMLSGSSNNDFQSISTDILSGGRLGCWTCTVIRKDKATRNLIDNGYNSLEPLYNYRNWLVSIRDKLEYRSKFRRNGVAGKGPFTVEARKMMLDKLLKAQSETEYEIIGEEEIDIIKKYWHEDLKNPNYREQ
ncbi:phosphoadenosine phosphosulfate reductase family protein [Desulfofustis glycolicus]|uniref:DNA sulfur modification protein DndC n=1 Tax=Desulfofustis glycolicus DSM 9705 TaxID=1121409 RepID=A0A1M5YM99_9BACT|nr:phosphoadenosine phosphosulfate reductase family protein [Desulfofustis glycolicus]SHI13038.1 DNA sulfur modification protein DndC [Desulfofustis glycolicus DSM 9705]